MIIKAGKKLVYQTEISPSTNLTLNAGCGVDKWGDIRIDLSRYSWRYNTFTSANLIADVHFLPFEDKCFHLTKCFHVLEHCANPKLALNELRRVSKVVIIRVPVWHFYSYLIEVVTLFLFICTLRFRKVCHQIREIRRWRERYSDHKWYIRTKKVKMRINRFFGLPREYEIVFT